MAKGRGGRPPKKERRKSTSFNIREETKASLAALAAEEHVHPATLGARLLDKAVVAYAATRDPDAAIQAAAGAAAAQRPRAATGLAADPEIRSSWLEIRPLIIAAVARAERGGAAALDQDAHEVAMTHIEVARELRRLRRAVDRLAAGRPARAPEEPA